MVVQWLCGFGLVDASRELFCLDFSSQKGKERRIQHSSASCEYNLNSRHISLAASDRFSHTLVTLMINHRDGYMFVWIVGAKTDGVKNMKSGEFFAEENIGWDEVNLDSPLCVVRLPNLCKNHVEWFR